jgi:hypothetical protein
MARAECVAPDETTLHRSLPLADDVDPAIVVRGSSLPGASGSFREANSEEFGMSPSGDVHAARIYKQDT